MYRDQYIYVREESVYQIDECFNDKHLALIQVSCFV